MSLRRPIEQPVDSAKLRRRVLVFAGMWFLLAGMLAALGLIAVLLVSFGLALLGAPALQTLWTNWYNIPLVPYTNFNNSVTLGSFVFWLVAAVPLYFLGKVAIARYRATYGARVMNSKFMKGLKASKAYNVYSWFRPE